jgi:3-hydroxyisobutyrate dehydrogenase
VTRIAVLGAGTIGEPIARNLLRAGFAVAVWNRTREKANPLAAAGATVCDRPADAVAGAEFVLTVLSDGDAVAEVMEEDGVLGAMSAEAVWLQLSTVGVVWAERLAELAAERGTAYVDAPVLGTRKPAEDGELVVLASGADELEERCAPVFGAIGRQTRWFGPAGCGSRMKMVVNLWLIAIVEGAAEAIALAEGLGLDPRGLLATVAGGPLDSQYLQLKGKAIMERSLAPSFKLSLAEKDARLVLEAGEQAGVELPLARAVRDAFERAVELGHGDEDLAAVYFATAVHHAEGSSR